MANTPDTIPPPLFDRCEVIQLSGHIHDEKLHLAQNGLSEEHVRLTEPALLRVVTHYTREAGVHGLEHAIGGVVRFKAIPIVTAVLTCHVGRQRRGDLKCQKWRLWIRSSHRGGPP